MLNKTYRILKYIQKNPGVSKTTLIEKFPDFCIDEYVKSNMPSVQQPTADSSIVYSTTLKFDEYREQRIRNLFLFLVPYAITTAIAIASILVQILV